MNSQCQAETAEAHAKRKYEWFCAETLYGKIYIGLDRTPVELSCHDRKLPDVLRKAVTLCHGEYLITQIEEWLNCGLSLQPVTIIPNSIHTITLKREPRDIGVTFNEIMVGFQDNLLGKLSEPAVDQLPSTSIETSDIPVQIDLSEFQIPTEQYEQIEQGRVLLIPGSYERDWWVKLHVPVDSQMSCLGILNGDVRTLIINSQSKVKESDLKAIVTTSDNNYDFHPLTITISDTVQIPIDRLLGWRGENTFLLHQSLRHYKTDIWCYSDKIASGHLMPVADGFGVFIDG